MTKARRACADCHTPWPVDRLRKLHGALVCEMCWMAQFYYERSA